jgi:hypothetical protein
MNRASFFSLCAVRTAYTVCVVWLVAACSFEAAVPKYSGTASSPPELIGVRTSSSSEVDFMFSEPVSVVSVTFDPPAGPLDSTDGEMVNVRFDAPYIAGTKVTVDLLVRNGDGSTLEAVLTFSAFNDRIPKFQINELRTETSKPRVEFIELKMLTAGNLAGTRLFIASNGTEMPVYEMPAAEVGAGEYVVVHLRSPDYINSHDEVEGNLALSTADDTKAQADCPKDARDLWVFETTELLRKSDAVYFMDQTDNVIDAVVFCDKAKDIEKWESNALFAEAMTFLSASGAWDGGNIDGVFDSSGISPTNTINRRENAADTNTAADWYKSGTSKASPGKANVLP